MQHTTFPKHARTRKDIPRPQYPTERFPFSHFLVSGGSILFVSTHDPLRICLTYHHARGKWLLPKGRGESVTAAAVHETFEGTRCPCKLPPLDLITRANHRYGDGRGRERRTIHGDSAPDEGGQDADPLVVREGVYGRLG